MNKRIQRTILAALMVIGVLALAACTAAEAEEVSVTLDDQTKEELMNEAANGSGAVYTDGTYTGVADGFGDNLTVEVEIADGLISSVAIVSHNEVGEQFYGPAMDEVPGEIIAAQSVDVDSVSGATYTSVGIKNAVLGALEQALESGTLPQAEALPTGGHGHH